mmetsp:Transcript_23458/g.53541  ORF Transcript_23458/g.53541 Transcript_23458/m.53541 type:complete len:268 (+) Transcript_23458:271-1074(+)
MRPFSSMKDSVPNLFFPAVSTVLQRRRDAQQDDGRPSGRFPHGVHRPRRRGETPEGHPRHAGPHPRRPPLHRRRRSAGGRAPQIFRRDEHRLHGTDSGGRPEQGLRLRGRIRDALRQRDLGVRRAGVHGQRRSRRGGEGGRHPESHQGRGGRVSVRSGKYGHVRGPADAAQRESGAAEGHGKGIEAGSGAVELGGCHFRPEKYSIRTCPRQFSHACFWRIRKAKIGGSVETVQVQISTVIGISKNSSIRKEIGTSALTDISLPFFNV